VQPVAPEHAYFKHANRGYLDWGIEKGIRLSPEPTIFQLYCEPLQRFRLAAQGHGDRQPPDHARDRIETYFDPLPFWYPPFEGEMVDETTFPLHAITQRPMHMYHSWGSQNAWLRQITAENRLYIHRDLGARIGVRDDDWVWIASHMGRVKCQVRLMDGREPAHGLDLERHRQAQGRVVLGRRRAGGDAGFPAQSSYIRTSARGRRRLSLFELRPDHGQAAWFDLRVSIEKADGTGQTEPRFEALGRGGLPAAPSKLAYGKTEVERA
jgi:anaerobic selenocysteine-containing dehydrogenase